MEDEDGAELCFPQFSNTSCRKSSSPWPQTLVLYIVCYSISLNTVTLNLLIIISISHFRQLHTTTNILLLSLAVSDILVGLVLMPVEVLKKTSCWFLGDFVCFLYNYLTSIITVSSIGDIVLISVDRYVAICDPLHYNTRITVNRVKLSVFLCWLYSACYSFFFVNDDLTQPGRYNLCYGECVLVIDYFKGLIDLVLSFIVPVILIVSLYLGVFAVAVSQARAMRSHITAVTLQHSVTPKAKKSQLKAARNLGVLVVVFIICYSPFYCASLAGEVNALSASYVLFVFFCNSSLNPVIYAFLYPWFRKAVKLIVTLQILQPGSCETSML
ncbi:trace amine-associated receptor 13c-like [Etheostoma spectabile]|uniref:trace amine-associated receptor 13c-like n=1 Tax=Etheostoma spectabile TaxID=54343 RepID=UPI0013AFC906|nr:trace amine-associated receptor 13c-like [Etheostoma spectabile]